MLRTRRAACPGSPAGSASRIPTGARRGHIGIVLLAAEDLGVLAARHDAVKADGLVAALLMYGAPLALKGFGVPNIAEMSGARWPDSGCTAS